jgi:peptidoglycan/xylan/chitin deacetylase (PgdA/CDA1 family)
LDIKSQVTFDYGNGKTQMLRKWSRANRIIKHRLVPHALILMYHRVEALENDPHLLAVTPENFASHLEVIQQYASPISLAELTQAIRKGRVPHRAVAITFDDGYTDNLYKAKPLLERFCIPATVFVTASQMGGRQEFWWDELDRLLLQPGRLPPKLRLGFNGNIREWNLSDAVKYTQADYKCDKTWHIEQDGAPTARQRIFRELFDWLFNLPERAKHTLLDDLREWAGVEATARPTHKTMNSEELILLTETNLVNVGAHTMTHPVLATLSVGEQRSEIQQSRKHLESILKTPVTSFAFPHGSNNAETISILGESGFVCACNSHPEPVWRNADPFQLPRVGVRNLDKETFTHWFKWWMNG